MRSVKHFQGVCKIPYVDILLFDVLDAEILLSHFNDSAEITAPVFDQSVFFYVFQVDNRVNPFFCLACIFGIDLFCKQKFYVLQNTRIEDAVLRRHKHYDGYQPHNDRKRITSRRDCHEDDCKHDERNDYVRHRIAFPYRVFYFDFLRNNSHSVLSPPLSEFSVVSSLVPVDDFSSEYLSELSPPPFPFL